MGSVQATRATSESARWPGLRIVLRRVVDLGGNLGDFVLSDQMRYNSAQRIVHINRPILLLTTSILTYRREM